jgi:hypothetical protein
MYTSIINKIKEKANKLHKDNIEYIECPEKISKWIGITNIFIRNKTKRNKIIDKYKKIKGDISKLYIIDNNTIEYKDHVSRIYINKNNSYLPNAIYTFPTLSKKRSISLDINKPKKNILNYVKNINFEDSIITEKSEPFSYKKMETGEGLKKPLTIGFPSFIPKLLDIEIKFENVLHLPIKITKKCEEQFEKEERLTLTGKKILHNKIYLPKELKKVEDYIQILSQIEIKTNPNFLLDYYMFLSISDSEVLPNNTHRRGGWHIDGHQGYERLINSTTKHLTDRQYIICNNLPTEFYPMKFDFSKLRKKYILDSINIQEQIEKITSIQENKYPHLISYIKENEINFLTPYMVHRGQTNISNLPISRKFVRLICSTYSRDRFGDTINPIFGPLNPLKIKTVTDIYEVN